MAPSLLLLFNHEPTPSQLEDAFRTLGVSLVEHPPQEIRRLWQSVPPELERIGGYLKPIAEWVSSVARAGDFILIQGDFGATWLMVNLAFEGGLIPVYSTTERKAVEEAVEDGTVKLSHQFKHVRFRKYGE
ncbi:MAG: CRISPR-associated protein Csx20 [Desulfobacterales bacterium]